MHQQSPPLKVCGTPINGSLHLSNLAIVMVGLPASNKSFLSRNLSRYLRWLGYRTFTFSAAAYRQLLIGTDITADFFDASREDFLEKRTLVADRTLDDMVSWFQSSTTSSGQVAILDATNTIEARRRIILDRLTVEGIKVIFIECVYETDRLLNEHSQYLHLLCPDYEKMAASAAHEDYQRRIFFYRQTYEPIEDSSLSFIKVINGGEKLIVNRVNGYLSTKIIYYLMNLHLGNSKIFLKVLGDQSEVPAAIARVDEILQNAATNGTTKRLKVWFSPEFQDSDDRLKGCCSLDSINSTSASKTIVKPSLAQLNPGVLESLEDRTKIAETFPEVYDKYIKNPFTFRFPRAESYADLSKRLENVIMELERDHDNILIVADVSVIRCIYAYYIEMDDQNRIPSIQFDADEIIELDPLAYGCLEARYKVTDVISSSEPVKKTFRPYKDNPSPPSPLLN